MPIKITAIALSVCLSSWLLVGPVSAQSGSGDPSSILLDIRVIEFGNLQQGDFEKITKEKNRISSLVEEGKAQPVASLQIRLRAGEQGTTRIGQRIPVLPPESAPSASGPPQVRYENTGLVLSATANIVPAGQIEIKLGLEMTLLDRGTGSLTPIFVHRSMNNVLRVKPEQTAVWLGLVQHEPLYPARGAGGTVAPAQPQGSFVVAVTARPID